MPFVPDDEQQQPQVPSANEPMLLSTGQTTMSSPTVVTDANKANPRFVPDELPYTERQPGMIEQALPKELQPYAGRIADIATGANETLAGALGVPSAAIANVFNGLTGRGLTTSDDMKAAIQQGLRSIPGMGAAKEQAFNDWYADLGEQAGKQALITMALISGAAPLAAAGDAVLGASVGLPGPAFSVGQSAGALMKNVGEAAVLHPGMVAAADAGSVAGQALLPQAGTFLEGMGINANPDVLALLGALGGGVFGSMFGSMARIRPVGLPGTPEASIKGGLPRPEGKLINDSMKGVESLLPSTGRFTPEDVSSAVSHYKDEVTSWLQNRIGRLTQDQTNPSRTANRVRQVVKEGSEKARVIVDNAWTPINQNRPVPVDEIQAVARQIATSAQDPMVRSTSIPGNFIRDVLKWKGPITMKRLRQMASAITTDSVNLGLVGTSGPPSDVMRSNLTALSKSMYDAIEKAYPGDIQLAKAKELSTWYHDTFSRGPVGEFGLVRTPQGYLPDAQTSLEGAMRHDQFGPQMSEMGARTGMQPEVQTRTEDFLRSTVAEAYRKAQPIVPGVDPLATEAQAAAAAAKHMNSPEFKDFQKAFPALDAVLQRQFSQLQGALGRAVEIRRSAFLDKAGTDPEAAAEALVNSGSKVRDAALIMRRIGGEEKAAIGLATMMMRKIGDSVHWDPNMLASRMGSKDLRRTFGIILGPDQAGRLERILKSGLEFQGLQNNAGVPRKVVLKTGNVIGSLLTRAAGMNTIQATSIGSQTGGALMERLFHIIPPEQMLANALVDPNWERFLLSKLPENLASMKATTRSLGLLVGTIEAGQRKFTEDREKK